MSASSDKTQKPAFVYSNLYHLYRKDQHVQASAPEAIAIPRTSTPGVTSGKVLKADDASAAAVSIESYRPTEFLGKRLDKPMTLPKPDVLLASQNDAIKGLKQNLQSLNDLHSRLRVMLKELEDLVRE